METHERHISIEKTARYHLWGNTESPEMIWYVLHGYGQLSKFFIRKFNSLDPNKHLVVAPEGLHRFYLSGSAGRVGASWMTKDDRLNDIKDYVHYLDRLHESIGSNLKQTKICVLGFSQGSATASRWVFQGNINPDFLVLWSSTFPPDLEFSTDIQITKKMKSLVVYGDSDEYMSLDNFNEHFDEIERNGIQLTKIPFEGDHNIYPQPLKKLESSMIFD